MKVNCWHTYIFRLIVKSEIFASRFLGILSLIKSSLSSDSSFFLIIVFLSSPLLCSLLAYCRLGVLEYLRGVIYRGRYTASQAALRVLEILRSAIYRGWYTASRTPLLPTLLLSLSVSLLYSTLLTPSSKPFALTPFWYPLLCLPTCWFSRFCWRALYQRITLPWWGLPGKSALLPGCWLRKYCCRSCRFFFNLVFHKSNPFKVICGGDKLFPSWSCPLSLQCQVKSRCCSLSMNICFF